MACVVLAASCSSGGRSADPPERRSTALRYAVTSGATVDPATAVDPDSISLAELTATPLVVIDPATSEPRPGLASRWTADRTQTVFTFTLDRNARFSTGAPVTAPDVVASLNRVVVPATSSPVADLLAEVEGYAVARAAGTPLEGIRAIGSRRVEITLNRADATFPTALGHPALGIVRPDADAPGGFVGAGAYAVARSDASGWILRRRRGGGAERIVVRRYPDATASRAAVTDGDADLALISRDAGTTFGGGLRPVSAPYVAVSNYALDLSNPKFANPDFRRAILQALDGSALVRSTFGPTVGVANGVIPETVAGHGRKPCRGVCEYDPDGARTALARAFPAGGVPAISIDHDATPTQTRLAEVARQQLAAVGITANPRPHPVAEYDDFLANGDPELFRLGWVASDPSAEAFLLPVFATGAPENVAHVSSLAADLTAIAASRTADAAERNRLYRNAERSVLEQIAVKPVVQYRTRYLARSRVRGLAVDLLGGIFADYPGLAER